jgi:hypothetical protein
MHWRTDGIRILLGARLSSDGLTSSLPLISLSPYPLSGLVPLMLDRIAAQIRSGQKIYSHKSPTDASHQNWSRRWAVSMLRATASFLNYRATIQLACAAVRDSESQK